jgi:hypothetical protein
VESGLARLTRGIGILIGRELGCAIIAAIDVLGDPWSMLVLRDVIFGRSPARVLGDTSFAAVRRTSVADARMAASECVSACSLTSAGAVPVNWCT